MFLREVSERGCAGIDDDDFFQTSGWQEERNSRAVQNEIWRAARKFFRWKKCNFVARNVNTEEKKKVKKSVPAARRVPKQRRMFELGKTFHRTGQTLETKTEKRENFKNVVRSISRKEFT